MHALGSPSSFHPFRLLRTTAQIAALLVASALSGAELQLQWDDNSSDETGFKIERADGAGSFAPIGTVGANVVTFRDGAVSAGGSYRYRVRAYNSAGDSAYSNEVAHTVPAINTAPTISSVANQVIPVGGTIPALAFVVGDAQSTADRLTVTASSSNSSLLSASGLLLGGTGADRTLSLAPVAGATGEATVTLVVSDGQLSSSTQFRVTVVNTAPTISAIANQSLVAGASTATLTFTIGDAETAATALTVTRASSNTSVIPTTAVQLGGSGANRTVVVSSLPGVTGTSTITLAVSDGLLTTARSFTVTVTAPVITNTPPTITAIPAQSVGSGSTTSALPFTVGDSQTLAGDLRVTAVSSNTTVVPATGLQLGGTGASRSLTIATAAGRTGTATITVSVSDGSLSTSTSFVLTVQNSAPTILGIMDQVVAKNGSLGGIPVRIGDAETMPSQLAVTATSSNTTLLPVSRISFSGTGANRLLSLTPSTNKTGTATVTVNVSDGQLNATTRFSVLVTTGTNGPEISVHPVSRLVKAGTDVALAVDAFGSPSPSYQWRKNGVAISGATGASLTLRSVQASQQAVYDVVLRNKKGTKISRPALVMVNAPTAVGSHHGTFGTYGNWSILVRGDQTSLVLAGIPQQDTSVALEVEMTNDGATPVVHTEVGPYVPLP